MRMPSLLKTEYLNQIQEAEQKLSELQTRRIELSKQRKKIESLDDAKLNREEIADVEGAISDLTILRDRAKEQVAEWDRNEPQATEVRKRLVELWSQTSKSFAMLHQALSDISSAITEIDQLSRTMWQLCSDHERLIGETITVPAISSLIPVELRSLPGIKLRALSETLDLKFESQGIQEAQERLEANFNDKLAKQKRQVLSYLESQNMQWPKCERCGQELVLLGGSVYSGSQQETTFGGPEVREKAFSLQFACEAGNHLGRQGFLRVQGGNYMNAPLTQLEIER